MLWTELERFGSIIDPWRSFERANRAPDGLLRPTTEFPLVNVWSDGNSAVLTAELPGIDPAAVDISVMGSAVTIGAARNAEEIGEGESYHRRERWYGRFTRTIDLPYTIDAAKVDARFNRGVLHLTMPRAVEAKPKKIEIRTE